MGFLDRVIGGVNQAHEKTTDAEYAVFRDRRYDAAERLAQSGEEGHAIITGIRGRWNDETTELVYRLEWNDGGMRSGAIRFGGGAASSLRIGPEVLETWAAVEAGLIHDRVAPGDYDAYATERFGVPAGRWKK